MSLQSSMTYLSGDCPSVFLFRCGGRVMRAKNTNFPSFPTLPIPIHPPDRDRLFPCFPTLDDLGAWAKSSPSRRRGNDRLVALSIFRPRIAYCASHIGSHPAGCVQACVPSIVFVHPPESFIANPISSPKAVWSSACRAREERTEGG